MPRTEAQKAKRRANRKSKKGPSKAPKITVPSAAPVFAKQKDFDKMNHLTKPRAPRGPSGGSGSGSAAASVTAALSKNAQVYVAAQCDPFNPSYSNLRVPDLVSYPTIPCCFKSSVQLAPGAAWLQVACCPSLANGASTTTGSPLAWRTATGAAATYGAWNYVADPNYNTAYINGVLYRTVAYGAKFVQTTELQHRAGFVRGYTAYRLNDLPTTPAETSNLALAEEVSLTSDLCDTYFQTWRPLDYEYTLDLNIIASTVPKGCLVFDFYLGASATYFDVNIEMVHHLELVPTIASSVLLSEVGSSNGAGEDVARAWATVEKVAGDVAGSVSPIISQKLATAAARVVGGLATQTVRRAWAAAGGAPSLAAIMDRYRHVEQVLTRRNATQETLLAFRRHLAGSIKVDPVHGPVIGDPSEQDDDDSESTASERFTDVPRAARAGAPRATK